MRQKCLTRPFLCALPYRILAIPHLKVDSRKKISAYTAIEKRKNKEAMCVHHGTRVQTLS